MGRQAKLGYSAASAMRPATFWRGWLARLVRRPLRWQGRHPGGYESCQHVGSAQAGTALQLCSDDARRTDSEPAAQVLQQHSYGENPIQACSWAPSKLACAVVTKPSVEFWSRRDRLSGLLVFTNMLEPLWNRHEGVRSWAWAPCSSCIVIATRRAMLQTITWPSEHTSRSNRGLLQQAVLDTGMPLLPASHISWSSSSTWCFESGGQLLAQHAAGRLFSLSLPSGMHEVEHLVLSPSGSLILLAGAHPHKVPGYGDDAFHVTILWLLNLRAPAPMPACWSRLPLCSKRFGKWLLSVAFHSQERFFAAVTAASVLVSSLAGEVLHRVRHSSGSNYPWQLLSPSLTFSLCGCRLLIMLDGSRALVVIFGPAGPCCIGFDRCPAAAGYLFALHGLAAPPPTVD